MGTFDEFYNKITEECNEGIAEIDNLLNNLFSSKDNTQKRLIYLKNRFKIISCTSYDFYSDAIIDTVGIYSKKYFLQKLQILEEEQNLALIIGDIDYFKKYNTAYAYVQADLALECVAKQFKESMERRLISRETGTIARYGGEEFCALIQNYKRNLAELEGLSDEIRKDIERLELPKLNVDDIIDDGYKHITMTFSAGTRKNDEGIKEFFHYVSKELTAKDIRGRNKVYVRK